MRDGINFNKSGPAQVGAISKNSKKTSKCQVFSFTVLENRKSKLHTQNNGPSGAPGPLTRAPGALKSHNAEKQRGGTLWGFSTSILSQNIKKFEGGPFGEFFSKKKSRSAEKMKGGTLWSHPVWYVSRKNRKNFFGSVR